MGDHICHLRNEGPDVLTMSNIKKKYTMRGIPKTPYFVKRMIIKRKGDTENSPDP